MGETDFFWTSPFFRKQIDKRYAEIIWYQEALEQEKNTILDALKLVCQTFRGDKGAYARLRASGAIRQKGLLPKSILHQKNSQP